MTEDRKFYRLIGEPRAKTYQALLKFAQTKCAYFLLVEKPGLPRIDAAGTAVLVSLLQFLIEEKETKEWPGTVLLGNNTNLH